MWALPTRSVRSKAVQPGHTKTCFLSPSFNNKCVDCSANRVSERLVTMTQGAARAAIVDLRDFESRNTSDGLFLRYCRGRVASFLARQTLTGFGSLAIGLFSSVGLGVATALLALFGEVVDCLVLRRIHRSKAAGKVSLADLRWARLTAAIQGLTISGCVILCWAFVPLIEGRFFAFAFLIAAVINAGLARPFFPSGVDLRLCGYAATGLVLMATELKNGAQGPGTWFFLAAAMMLAYAAVMFIHAVGQSHAQRMRFEHALLREKHELDLSRQALAEQSRQAERLALVAHNANDSVIFTSTDGRIEWVNEAFIQTTGYSFAEAVGQFPGDVLNCEETSAETLGLLLSAQREGRSCRIELANRTKAGKLIWMEISMAPVFGPDGLPELFIAVERDITKAKHHAAELARAQIAAEAATEAKSRFLANMSHEIRTPMNGVMGVAELLGESELDQTQRQYVDTIIDCGQSLLAIINDVLDLSKLQAGKMETAQLPFSLTECAERVVTLLQPVAAKKELSLRLSLSSVGAVHLGDAGMLRQILFNLIGNAVKFTKVGGVSVDIRVAPDGDSDRIKVTIADTGIGIPADRLEQIFDSFSQADSATTRVFGGTGLGLTISRMLAGQLGGDIRVTSEPGRGSEFTLSLRLRRADIALVVVPAARAKVDRPQTSLRVQIAEDNRTNMLILRKMLDGSVASIIEASTGLQAVSNYRSGPPDLVFMDLSMPEMDGLQATRQIREFEAESGLARCQIIALTAHTSAEDRALCFAAGMDDVLTKPFSRAALYTILEGNLNSVQCEGSSTEVRPHGQSPYFQ